MATVHTMSCCWRQINGLFWCHERSVTRFKERLVFKVVLQLEVALARGWTRQHLKVVLIGGSVLLSVNPPHSLRFEKRATLRKRTKQKRDVHSTPWNSRVVTDRSTTPAIRFFCKRDRTGSPILIVLWSNAKVKQDYTYYERDPNNGLGLSNLLLPWLTLHRGLLSVFCILWILWSSKPAARKGTLSTPDWMSESFYLLHSALEGSSIQRILQVGWEFDPTW